MITTISTIAIVICVIVIIGIVVHDTFKLWRKSGNSDDTIASLIRRNLDDTLPSSAVRQTEETLPERYQQLLDESLLPRLVRNCKYLLSRLKKYFNQNDPNQ